MLAVFAGLVIVRPFGADHDSVTASEAVPAPGVRAELPSVLEVRCKPSGIDVPVASVRPQRDGMHMHVVNALDAPTRVEVRSTEWSSGAVAVPVGAMDLRQPVPPGVLTIGCDIAGHADQRRVDLVDADHFYRAPKLACDDADQKTLEDVPVEPAVTSVVRAARQGLGPVVTKAVGDDAEIGPVIGYVGQRLSDPTEDPVVQVGPPGAAVAFVHVRGADQSAAPPWTTLASVDICASALAGKPPTTTTPPSTTSTTEAKPSHPLLRV